ncbi:hypothetical protein GQ55_5G147800 [Panicum hallii var. hallii]|uniref:Uncharacterized protein n=1 Tax=Panicum hallii var. hallii TaxID=1504633 RepID=A0A2T7DGD5_9POAL|nr:hypothetical protein GQ55_5G147800 [Panicum hallii var. hallii]
MHSATSDLTSLSFPVSPSSHPVSELSLPSMADLGFQSHQITVFVQNLDLLAAVEHRSPAMRGPRQHQRRAGTADGSGVVPVLAPRYRTPLALRCGAVHRTLAAWRRRG